MLYLESLSLLKRNWQKWVLDEMKMNLFEELYVKIVKGTKISLHM